MDYMASSAAAGGCVRPRGRAPPFATEEAFTDVAYAIDEPPAEGEGLTLRSLAESLNLPLAQVNVAMEFPTERGVLDVRRRRSYRASHCAFENAMREYHALAEARREGR
jgi:hypothetical protein